MRQVSTRDSNATFVRLTGVEDMASIEKRLLTPVVLSGTIRLMGAREFPISCLILLVDRLIQAGAKKVEYKSAAVRGHGWELAHGSSMGLIGH